MTDTITQFAPLNSLGETFRYCDGAEVFGQGAPASSVYRIMSGVVRTTRVTEDGRRQIGDFHFSGDLVGLEESEVHAFAAEALGVCEIVVIRRAILDREAARDIDVAHALHQAASTRLRQMQRHLIQIGRKSAIERVAAVLSQFSGHANEDVIDLPMSRQDIADYLGLTIETVSRMISQLQASKVIRLTTLRQVRICDPQALRLLAA